MTHADLHRARADLRVFSEAIGQPLTESQASSLGLEQRTTVIVGARQCGKSRSLAVLALHRAFRLPGQHVLVVSAGESAARRLLGEVTAVAMRSALLAGSVTDETAGLVRLSNGSSIRSVPASERAVRGWSVDLLLCDEAALIEDELLLAAAIPTTAARPDARIVLAGTPAGPEGAFYTFAELGEQGAPDVVTHVWRLSDAPWIADSVVDSARAALAPAQFRREFEALFADVGADERVIAPEWVAAAQARQIEADGPAVIGVDLARHGGDESVAVRVQAGVVSVLWAIREPDLMATAGRIWDVSGQGSIWLDVTGLGYGVADRLAEQGVRAAHFVAGGSSSDRRRWLNLRAEAWWHARSMFEGGVVQLPDDRVLAGQLSAVRYRLASSGAIQIQAKEEMRKSPDRADALVIALWASRQALGWAQWAQQDHYVPVHPLVEGAEMRRYGTSGLTGDLMGFTW
jgi:hypothetical protein